MWNCIIYNSRNYPNLIKYSTKSPAHHSSRGSLSLPLVPMTLRRAKLLVITSIFWNSFKYICIYVYTLYNYLQGTSTEISIILTHYQFTLILPGTVAIYNSVWHPHHPKYARSDHSTKVWSPLLSTFILLGKQLHNEYISDKNTKWTSTFWFIQWRDVCVVRLCRSYLAPITPVASWNAIY